MKLDQFYTKSAIAKKYYEFMLLKLARLGVKNPFFVEPSAGSGSFFDLLNSQKRIGLDIEPKSKDIKKQNFLTWQYNGREKSNVVVIGNPPFGRRAKLAIEFFNKSTEFAHTIGFIVPVQFRKYSVHSKLNPNYKLIAEKFLPENSFITEDGIDFNVNCVFQIWTKKNTTLRNKRIVSAPPIKHPDFEIYQYNNTKEALKVLRLDFDFAVPRQGYEDYARREFSVQCLEKNKQLGKKLNITGGGRCNITNAEFDVRKFLSKFPESQEFLFSPFSKFSSKDTFKFFEDRGLPIKVEVHKRAFPETEKFF